LKQTGWMIERISPAYRQEVSVVTGACQFRVVNGLPFQCPWGWNITWLYFYGGILVFEGPISYPGSYKMSGHLVSLKKKRSSSVSQHPSPSSQRHPTRPTKLLHVTGIRTYRDAKKSLIQVALWSRNSKYTVYDMISLQSTWKHYMLGTVRDKHTKSYMEFFDCMGTLTLP